MIRRFNIILAAGMMLGLGALYTGPARAQDVAGPVFDSQRNGYQHGYRDGFEQGREAKATGRSADFHTPDYERADRGYQSFMGSMDAYKDGYRGGYEKGYSDGVTGNRGRFGEVFGWSGGTYDPDTVRADRWANAYAEHHWAARDVANDIGYRDGLAAGAKDATTGHSYRPSEHGAYKDGDHGYHKDFGSKDEYKRWYRESYDAGYRDGFGR